MINASIVKAEKGFTQFRINFPETTVLVTGSTLYDISTMTHLGASGYLVLDKHNDTDYWVDYTRNVVTIKRLDMDDVSVSFDDFDAAKKKAYEKIEDASAIVKIYGPKIFNEAILESMNNGTPVFINDKTVRGVRIIDFDKYAFKVFIDNHSMSAPLYEYVLHSHVSRIGLCR